MAINYSNDEILSILARTGPSSMLKTVRDIERCLEGKIEYSDPSTPFIMLLEASALSQADITLAHYQHLQKVYAKMATTKEDLYHTMTDEDFVGAFAYPSHGVIMLASPYNDIKSLAKRLDDTNIYHFIIPEGTVFTAGEFKFMVARQVDIRFMPKGGLQIIYSNSTLNDVFNFESNLINYEVKNIGIKGETLPFIAIDIDVFQMVVTSKEDTASETSGYNKTITFKDQFFMCRVYTRSMNNTGQWVGLNVTHSKMNYDIAVPTATITLLENAVKIKIPDIYFSKGLISSTVLVEVFTTKGNAMLNLYEFGDGTTIKLGLPESKYYQVTQTAPCAMIKSLTSSLLFGKSNIVGGINVPTFDTLKERHINHALTRKRPVSDIEIRNRLIDYGFDVSLSEETVTKRLFLGSRELPPSTFGKNTAFATTTMASLYTTLDKLRLNARVIDNGRRLTILPSALYSISGKNIQILDGIVADKLELMDADTLSQHVKNADYACTPFYHVLDSTGSTFEYRVYQLDSPKITNRSFVNINTTTEVTFGSSNIVVEFREPNYYITVFAKSSGEFDTSLIPKIFTQLTYTTPDKSYIGAINGRYVGESTDNEYIWEFKIETGLDIDVKNQMNVKNILIKNNELIETQMLLKQPFNLIYGLNDYTTTGLQKTEMDKLVVSHSGEYVAMVQESLIVTFGKHLDSLYTRSRSIKGNNQYQVYTDDVYDVYTENIYEIDEVTGAPKYKIVDGKMQFNIIHKKGDYVLDHEGHKVVKYEAGSIKKDGNGEPILVAEGIVDRTIDLFLINAIYRFASHANDRNYYASLGDTVVGYIENYIEPVGNDVDNGTKIKFYPKVNLGEVLVRGGEETQFTVNSALPFTLRVALSEEKYSSMSFREEIQQTIINILREEIKQRHISLNNLAKVISNNLSDDVFGVTIRSPYLSIDVPLYTLVNDTEVFTLARTLEKLANGVTQVGYDVQIDWVKQLN